jgi:Spy/CpxP family protein refolding chaperone
MREQESPVEPEIGGAIMHTRLFSWILFAGLLAFSAPLAAEDRAVPQTSPQVEQRGAAIKKFRVIRIAELQEALNLDEKTTIKVNGVMTKYDNQRDASRNDLREQMRSLRDLMAADKPDEARITRTLDKLLELRAHMHDIHLQELKELRQILTPVQQAKFVLMMEKFQKRMHQAIRKSWMERGAGGDRGPGAQGPGGELPPPPDDGF